MTRPIQRAGHIAYTGNRYGGADVFTTLAQTMRTPTDLLLHGLGARPLDDDDREIVRCIALALTSPDARVWPLKLVRTLASHGSPFAGFYGAQLASATDKMGPATGAGGAAALAWLDAWIGDRLDDEVHVRAGVTRCIAERGRIAGFGVPFRAEDERVVGMRALLAGHPATTRRPWQVHLRVAAAMRALHDVPHNVVLPIAALSLDLGLPPHRVGVFMSMMMTHTFAAHAVEASEPGGEVLRALPADAVDYRGRAPRRTPAASGDRG